MCLSILVNFLILGCVTTLNTISLISFLLSRWAKFLWWLAFCHLLLVLHQYSWRESFNNPFMIKPFIWSQSLFRVPLEATSDQVNEWRIGIFPQFNHYVPNTLFLLLISQYISHCRYCIIFKLGKQMFACWSWKDWGIRHSYYINDQLNLFTFICARE